MASGFFGPIACFRNATKAEKLHSNGTDINIQRGLRWYTKTKKDRDRYDIPRGLRRDAKNAFSNTIFWSCNSRGCQFSDRRYYYIVDGYLCAYA